MRKFTIYFTLILIFTTSSFSQNYTLSGYVKNDDSGEELLYAVISVLNQNKGTSTNQYGFFSLTLPKGSYQIVFSYIGFLPDTLNINLTSNISKNISLLKLDNEIDEVIITGSSDANVKSTDVGVLDLDVREAKLIPILFGEQDILKTMQLLPGVSASSEGSSGFYVRGGDSDQNLILLDEAPVYNASHLLGFFSVFNSDALNDMKMYKGGIPSSFGGRLSSVTDIRMKNGNMKHWTASGGIGLISSKLTVEGPIIKNRSSLIISGRRTYADFIIKNTREKFEDLTLYFYDLNLKSNIILSPKDRIFISGYTGRDDFGMSVAGFDWGNKTATLRWNHVFNNKLFMNTSIIYSDFNYGFKFSFNDTKIGFGAGIFDYNIKQDFSLYANTNNSIKFGWQSMYHNFKPMSFEVIESNPEDTLNIFSDTSLVPQYALESALYFSNEQKIGDNLTILYGLRFSIFNNLGPSDIKTYNDLNEITDIDSAAKNEIFNTYYHFEPRLNINFLINDQNSIKASYNRTVQYLHLLSNSTASSPTDMWMPSTHIVKPEIGDQVSVGFFRNFANNKFEFSTELFYKNLYNQVDFEDGAELFFNPDVEAEILQGIGRAYGAEFLLRKKVGNFTGWLSYTLLKSERKFDDIDYGNWFPARQDRRHDISVVAAYQILPKLNFSASWIYYTGDAVTFPVGKYYIDGVLVNLYSSRNANRMPNYHRLDLGLTWTIKETNKFSSDLNISVYNAYNRKNAYSITFQENSSGQSEAERLALFGTVPSITWSFKLK